MQYQAFQIYHIYNQGNNRKKIFFTESNYIYFKTKLKKYISPHADILAYCLMPNHFHFLVYTTQDSIQPYKKTGMQNLSFAIGQLLSSYSKAINRQENRTGSLFKSKTKANDGWNNDNDYKSVENLDGEVITFINNKFVENVFNYIHENPVKAGLAITKNHWRHSSASEYLEFNFNQDAAICNIKKCRELMGLLPNQLI